MVPESAEAQGNREVSRAVAADVAAGRRLFLGKARCGSCRAGPTLTQEEFHNIGVAGLSGDPAGIG